MRRICSIDLFNNIKKIINSYFLNLVYFTELFFISNQTISTVLFLKCYLVNQDLIGSLHQIFRCLNGHAIQNMEIQVVIQC